MKVYRIEHATHRYGPWNKNGPWHLRSPDGHQPSAGPTIGIDVLCRCRDWNIRYATTSEDQMRSWFHAFHTKRLADSGFLLAEYDVPEDKVAEGPLQCVFNLDSATHIRDRHPGELYSSRTSTGSSPS